MEKYEKDKEKSSRHMEAGRGKNGEPSVDALRRWFIWAGAALFICLLVVLAGAFLSSGKNKKEAAVLQLEAGQSVELGLNRKGTILRAGGLNAEGTALLAELDLTGLGLEPGLDLLIGALTDSGELSDTRAMLLTIQKSDDQENINTARMMEHILLYTESALKKRQSGALVYAGTIQQRPELTELAGQYGISDGKAGFVKNLVDKNTKLKLEDTGRLARMEIQDISDEINRNKYTTSFEVLLVKASYGEKETEEETAEESTQEPEGESAGESTPEGESSGENTETTGEGKEGAAEKKTTAAAPQTEAGKTPETAAAESGSGDSGKPSPETAAAGTSAPETAASETPEAPDTAAPPETSAPETTAAAPETTAVQPGAPEPGATAAPPEAPAPETAAAPPEAPVQEATSEGTAAPAANQENSVVVPDGRNQGPGVKSPLVGPGA